MLDARSPFDCAQGERDVETNLRPAATAVAGVRFVLLRPKVAGNIGAAARALKNFGLRDWALVAPQAELDGEARMMAVQALDVLAEAKRPATLDEAVADCAWVVGTSSRHVRGMRHLRPRAFAQEAAERLATGNVALVFGEERTGLSNEELARCHDLSSIPTDDAQPSVNLAQSVLLYAYELRLALDAAPPPAKLPLGATDDEHRQVAQALEALLRAGGFVTHDPRHALRTLLDPLERARLTRDEARLWVAALRSVGKALRDD